MRRLLVATALVLALAACTRDALLEKFSRPGDRALAQSAIGDLQRGDLPALERLMMPAWRTELGSSFGKMRALVPPGQPRLIDASFFVQSTGERTSNLVYALDGDGRHVAIFLRIVDGGRTTGLDTFRIDPLKGRAEDSNDFTLEGKSVASFAMLFAALASVGISIAALVKVWRSGLFTRRWLWTLGCVVGVGRIMVDWSSGALNFLPLSVHIIPAGAVKQGMFAPWQLFVSVPIFAVIVLFRRDRRDAPTE